MSAIVNLSDFEDVAKTKLEPAAYAYYAGGAADEITLLENQTAWSRWRLRPRVLVDVATIKTDTTLLGAPVAMPIGIAPTALHGLAHPEAEVAMARGASDAGLAYTMSSLATRPVEDLAAAGLEGPRWFQVYDHRDRSITADMVARAEAAGCKAIVLTVDLPVFGRREREIRSGFAQPDASGYGNFAQYASAGEVALVTAGLHSSQFTWKELDWLAVLSKLPLVVKGIHTGEDAAIACEHGVAGVWVSNHGGRQLDRVQAGADVLEEVVASVCGRAEVYVDGGIRRGTDVLVALALGAQAVFAGRPWLYALAYGGSDGVSQAAGIIRAELENAMGLLGTPTVGDVTRKHVTRS
ncbi:MAG: alpha-hydroxy acid oxidase [Acidimicrobiales bacterium]